MDRVGTSSCAILLEPGDGEPLMHQQDVSRLHCIHEINCNHSLDVVRFYYCDIGSAVDHADAHRQRVVAAQHATSVFRRHTLAFRHTARCSKKTCTNSHST